MRLSFEWLVALAVAVAEPALLSCSPAPPSVATGAHDPSNPHAAEGVDPVSALHVTSASVDAGVDASAAVYVCPMHPEVTSDHAGHCSKCGMTLTLKK